MTKFHLFSQDSVRLETAPTGGVRKPYIYRLRPFEGAYTPKVGLKFG